jgi:hypothetical protein
MNASVLDLDGTEAVELLLVTIGDRPRGSKNPRGAWAPSSSSKAMLVATEVRAVFWARSGGGTGSEAMMTDFILG